MSHTAEELLREPNQLPTIPAVAMKVITLARDPDVSVEQMARTLQMDPALAAKTLRFANSVYYAPQQPITSLRQAVVRLGLRGTKLLALSFSLISVCRQEEREFDYEDFWHRSLTQAVIARRLTQMHIPRLTDEGMLGGLLCDIACPILAHRYVESYSSVCIRYRLMHEDHAAAERQLLGTDHATAGAELLENWSLPAALCEAVRRHHQPQPEQAETPAQDNDSFRLSVILGAASELSFVMLYGLAPNRMRRLAELFKHYFLFGPDRLRALVDSVGPEVRQFARLLELRVPPHDQLERSARAEMLAVAMSSGGTAGEKA